MNKPLRANPDLEIDSPTIPPLNPSRFTKSDILLLLDQAHKWFDLHSAFAMCLNVALCRGAMDFAAHLAEGRHEAPMAQAFYLYRSGGLIPQAMELAAGPIASLIQPQMPLPGL